jgi:hypothetical protein
MTIPFTFIGGLLGIVAVVMLDALSLIVFGRSLSDLIFGHSGLQATSFSYGRLRFWIHLGQQD